MKICDRCKNPEIAALVTFTHKREGTEIDLCKECEAALHDFLSNPEAKKSRKKENKS